MCGIFGILVAKDAQISFEGTRAAIDHLFRLSESRGKESSGIAVQDLVNRKIWVTKDNIPASRLIRSKNYRDFLKKSLRHSFNCSTSTYPFAAIAHSRLVTNGSNLNNSNNQPVVKDGTVVIHNGIITNVDTLWQKYNGRLQREYEVDSEILAALIRLKIAEGKDISAALREIFSEIEGAASLAILTNEGNLALIATNTGSLYYLRGESKKTLIFASEEQILRDLIAKCRLEEILGTPEVYWLKPFTARAINLDDFTITDINLKAPISSELLRIAPSSASDIVVLPPPNSPSLTNKYVAPVVNVAENRRLESLLEHNQTQISRLQRCSRCVLPETFPFISFDDGGVCNFCRGYVKKTYDGSEEARLKERIQRYSRSDGKPNCLMAFSGGRDSSYGLHYVKNVLGLNVITFTYDWGMVTDLARRNIARITGKLGIENILVSADIKMKRDNIRKNVSAWLKNPILGLIPLFMAGDKQFFFYMNKIRRGTDIKLNIWCANRLENTEFKVGFCGIAPDFEKKRIDFLSLKRKAQLAAFYGLHFLRNPAYINWSIFDTLWAYYSYYAEPRNDLYQLFDHIKWDEKTIEDTLVTQYNWELAPDTTSTWRIGDGTASFYNYVYYTIAGFSEFDTFRSNQIREGMITRDDALRNVVTESVPRFQSIKWYLDTIKIDFEAAIRAVNSTRRLYDKH